MTVVDLLTRFGNWVLVAFGAVIAYVVWRERTVSRISTLIRDLERVDDDVKDLRRELKERAAIDGGITASLAAIHAQLAGLTSGVAEIKADLKMKADKGDH